MRVKVTIPKGFEARTQAAVKRALNALASVARDRMTSLAQQKLKSSAQSYTNGISTPVVQGQSVVIVLAGKLANMMEHGTSAFDLKKMLKGRKYVDIPFTHGRPGSPLPKAESNIMRAAVQAAKGAMSVRGPKNMPTKPETKSHLGFGRYTQKESKYGSMLSLSHSYKGSSQRKSVTFRRMSENSDPASWIHPGFKALGIFPLVSKEIRKLAPRVLADYIKQGMR